MSGPEAIKRLWSRPDLLGIEWADGTSSEFASLWLRDNLPEDRDPHSGQRLVDIADLPEDPRIRTATAQNGAVSVEWESESRRATFTAGWLRSEAVQDSGARPRRWLEAAALDAARDFA